MDVMMNMTTEDVRALRDHFTGRMNLEQFVGTLKKTLHDRIHSEVRSLVCAYALASPVAAKDIHTQSSELAMLASDTTLLWLFDCSSSSTLSSASSSSSTRST